MSDGLEETWRRRLEREREARRQAEALLEQKSLELFQANDELKGVVDALEASSSRLAAILDHTFAGILVVDEQGRMIEVNRAAKAMFGRSDECALGARVLDWLDPDSRALGDAAEASEIESDGGRRSEVRHEARGRRRDGSTFPLEFVITRLVLGESRHQVWILRDLTRQHEAEAARKALERDLQQAQKLEALGTMAGGVAHEINTPVQFIGTNLAYLRDGFEDIGSVIGAYRALKTAAASGENLTAAMRKAEAAENDADLDDLLADIPDAILQAEEGVTRVSKIVQAIKAFAHPGSEEQTAIDVHGAIDRTIEVCRGEWNGIADLETDYADDLPPISGDPGKFGQVMLNLIVNAAQAIDQQGRSSKGLIRICTKRDGDDVLIETTDDGCGIPRELHARVFEPFFTTKEVGKGSGQGLALCFKILTEHFGGTIGLASSEDRGASFLIRIPARAEDL